MFEAPIFGIETSGAFADEWSPRPRPPGHHLFLLTKKQGAYFFWYQKYATLVCQWFLAKIEGMMVIRAKKIPS